MKTCLRLTLFVCLILPLLAAAEKRVRVEAPCNEGSAFTISIPFKLPPDVDTVWYRWYFKGAPVEDTARVATRDNLKIAYTIPADSAYGEDVEAYFDYQLSDECCEAWTKSPVYVMTFACLPPAASAITGSTTVCASTTGLTYSVTNATGTTYDWVLPSGWTKTAGGTTNSITVTAGTAGGTISVTPTTTATSCVGAAQTLAVTVNAPSTLTRSTSGGAASQTVCQNTAITSIVYTRGGSATNSSISWSPSTPAGISYNASSGTISGTPTAANTYTYTITTTGSSPCAEVTATGTITANVASTLSRSGGAASQTVCQSSAITNIVYTRSGSATGFSTISWSPSTPAGISTSGGGSGTTYTISGTPTAINAYAYTITTTGGSCPATVTGTITRGGISTTSTVSVAAAAACTGVTGTNTVSVTAYSACTSGVSGAVNTISVDAYSSCSGGVGTVSTISVSPAN